MVQRCGSNAVAEEHYRNENVLASQLDLLEWYQTSIDNFYFHLIRTSMDFLAGDSESSCRYVSFENYKHITPQFPILAVGW